MTLFLFSSQGGFEMFEDRVVEIVDVGGEKFRFTRLVKGGGYIFAQQVGAHLPTAMRGRQVHCDHFCVHSDELKSLVERKLVFLGTYTCLIWDQGEWRNVTFSSNQRFDETCWFVEPFKKPERHRSRPSTNDD